MQYFCKKSYKQLIISNIFSKKFRMEGNSNSVVANMIKIRNDKRLSQQAVAEKLGVSVSTYSRIECQDVALSYNTLADFAKAFAMRVIDVITYPEIYVNGKGDSSTKVLIELDVTQDEFISMGLKDKVIKVLNK